VPLAANSSGGGSLLPLLFVIVIIAAMYFLMIRPQQRRAREMQNMRSTLGPGDEIMTSSGIYGEIVEIDETDDTILLEVAPDVVLRIARAAIARTVSQAQHDEESDGDETGESEETDETGQANQQPTGAENVIERRKD
jgi:preprotein translocase subunit YajC